MSSVSKELILVYVLEGIAIGVIVSTISSLGNEVNSNVEEEKKNKKMILLWTFTFLIAMISHVIAESLRHDRLVETMKNVSDRMHISRRLSELSPFKRKSL